MVFKRYIEKGGKRLGPYYYQNVRDKDGRIKSVYIGQDYRKHSKKKSGNAIIILSIILISALFGFYYLFYDKAISISGISAIAFEKKEELFDVDQIIIKVLLREDEFLARQIKITNTANRELDFSINVLPLSELVDIKEKEFNLKPGQAKTMFLNFTTSQKDRNVQFTPGVYTGRLVVKAANDERIIPVIVEIESKRVFFDMNLLSLSADRIVKKGEEINFEVRIFNLEAVQQGTVDMTYLLKDIEGNTIVTQSESVVVKNQASFSKTIEVPRNVNTGNYVFAAIAQHGSSIGTATYLFDVIEELQKIEAKAEAGIFNVCRRDVYCWSLLFFIILILILIIIFAYFTIGTWIFFRLTGRVSRVGKARAAVAKIRKGPKRDIRLIATLSVVISLGIFLAVIYLLFPVQFVASIKFLAQNIVYAIVGLISLIILISIILIVTNEQKRRKIAQYLIDIGILESEKDRNERLKREEIEKGELEKSKLEDEQRRKAEELKKQRELERKGQEETRRQLERERQRQLEEQKKKEQSAYEEKRSKALELDRKRKQEESKKLKLIEQIEQEAAKEKSERDSLIAEKEQLLSNIQEAKKKKDEIENIWNDKVKALEKASEKINEYEQRVLKIKNEHEARLRNIGEERKKFLEKLKEQRAVFEKELQSYEQKELAEIEKKAEGLGKKDRATFEKLKRLEVKSNISIKLKELKKKQDEELDKYDAVHNEQKDEEKKRVAEAVKVIEKELDIAEIKQHITSLKELEKEKEGALGKFEPSIANAQKKINAIEQRIKSIDASLAEKEGQKAQLKDEIRKLRPGVIARVMEAFRKRAVEKEKEKLIAIKAEEHKLEEKEKVEQYREVLYVKINEFKKILEEVESYIKAHDKDNALKSYAELKKIYDRIAHSEGLTVDAKKFLYERITEAYHRIKELHSGE